MSLIIPLIIGTLSIVVPGFFLALALLKKTKLHMFEIAAIGVIFGMIFPPTLIWLESYLIPISPIFSFSNTLYYAYVGSQLRYGGPERCYPLSVVFLYLLLNCAFASAKEARLE